MQDFLSFLTIIWMPWYDQRFKSYGFWKLNWAAEFLLWTKLCILRYLNVWLQFKGNLQKHSIPILYLTFSVFQQLLMWHNWTIDSGGMTPKSCRWLLETLAWTEGSNLSISEFELNWSEIWGNFEYKSCRDFEKLPTEGGNPELWYRTKESWNVEVDRILEIWLRIWINF
jgi:hypothetical protein